MGIIAVCLPPPPLRRDGVLTRRLPNPTKPNELNVWQLVESRIHAGLGRGEGRAVAQPQHLPQIMVSYIFTPNHF